MSQGQQSEKLHEKLRELSMTAARNAHSPYSNVQVGSAVETKNGKLYAGCNIENCSFGATICAERVAIFKAISEGEKEIKRIYVYTKDGWPPCGCCRQVMMEFSGPELEIIIGNIQGTVSIQTLSEILPKAFGPKNL